VQAGSPVLAVVRQSEKVASVGWTWDRAFAVAAGGASGATLRWMMIEATSTHRFPWQILVVNLTGSLILGTLLAEEVTHPRTRRLIHDFGGIGLCGGLTTFSTFAVEVVDLADRGDAALAGLYLVVSVAGTIAAVLLGAGLRRRPAAAGRPVEETL
jgi:CrcB protein